MYDYYESAFATAGIAVFLIFVAGILLYFIPTIVASSKKHPQVAAIVIINIFLGWTFIGWIVALIWAATNPAPQQYITYNNPPYQNNSYQNNPYQQPPYQNNPYQNNPYQNNPYNNQPYQPVNQNVPNSPSQIDMSEPPTNHFN